tara:strand:+ start:1772 stop:3583 length:1812 start_codon:yes stop_codon:yes gene_type:complete
MELLKKFQNNLKFNSMNINYYFPKKMRIYLTIFSFFIVLLSYGQNWTQVSNFISEGRHHPITFSNDNYGFVVAGSYSNEVYRYDKSNDSWSQLSNFPAAGRGYSYGVTVGNKAYMGLGSTFNGSFPNDWWEYDMDNDTWTQLSNFPGNGRNHPAMIPVGNKIYMGCGSNTSNLSDWWEFDILQNSWTQKTSLPANDRHHPFYFGIGDFAYVGFGHGSSPGPGTNSSTGVSIYNDFYRYDPSNDSWLRLNDFPSEARVAGTQFSYNNNGYVLSGDGDDHGPLSSGEFWEYNPLTDNWSQLPSHPGDAIWAPGNFVIGCDVYFLLGQNNNFSTPVLPVEVYKYKLNQDCGCTDPTAFNYSSLAIIDDGTCCYISGCTDPYAINYDSTACYDNGTTCIFPIIGCMNSTASNFNPNANVTSYWGGALDISIGSGSYFNNEQHLNFSSSEECIIVSADVYSENPNTVTFELRNSSGLVIDDTTHLLIPGKQKIMLNFDVPLGNDFQLGVSAPNSGLYRNNSGVNYPYNIGDLIEITSSSASQPGYYYFYYNIKVEAICKDIVSNENLNSERKLIEIRDVLGRSVKKTSNKILLFIYDNGLVERKFIFE